MEWADRLRDKLDRLHPSDDRPRLLDRWRAKKRRTRERPVLDAVALADLELRLGVTLPGELRAFLQTVHGGGPGPGYGLEVWGDARAALPFPYGQSDIAELVMRRRVDPHEALPLTDEDGPIECWPPGPGFVVLTDTGCGMHDVIVTSGELRGSIWCCDMEWRPWLQNERLLTFLEWYERWLDGASNALAMRP